MHKSGFGVGDYRARRAVLRKAADLLAREARSKAFRPSYSKNNPGARLEFNVFHFGAPNEPPRAIIKDRWLYIHAPGVVLPGEVAVVSENERRMKHLGSLHARVSLRNEADLTTVRMVIERLVRSGSPTQ